ncbi:MAG: glycosyltransferase N-terminal domain-containing protein [Bacteroidota bacterium]
MGSLLYRIAVSAYHLGIRLAALFNPKARAWVDGRQNWLADLQGWRSTIAANDKVLWMHCASLGEFEQGRPVLEQLRKDFPHLKIVLSFYSPSGYELRKNYAAADYICYLPADTSSNAQGWITNLRPDLIVFVKYEFWYFHLQAAFDQRIPTFLIAGAFRPQQLFFRWYGRTFLQLLHRFQHLHVQTLADQQLLQSHGLEQVTVTGDPRVDQVMTIAQETVQYPPIAAFATGAQVFIAGSTWPPGEAILLAQKEWWSSDWKLLIAPHDISESHVQQIIDRCPLPALRYSSEPTESELRGARILVLDTIGMLSRVYRYGRLVYVGGGFGRSIHNTLEPAAYGLPLLFGPKHHKFAEAVALRESGGAFVIENKADFEACFAELRDPSARALASREVVSYLQQNQGATARIIVDLTKVLRPE